MVLALVLQLQHAGAKTSVSIFITCLKVVSLLKKLFFMHKQSLPQAGAFAARNMTGHGGKSSLFTQEDAWSQRTVKN